MRCEFISFIGVLENKILTEFILRLLVARAAKVRVFLTSVDYRGKEIFQLLDLSF